MAIPSVHTWIPFEELTSEQMNKIDEYLQRCVDGVGGGTYATTLTFTGLTITGTMLHPNGSTTNFNAGSTLNVFSTPTLTAGLSVTGGTNALGGTTNITGPLTVSAAASFTNTANFSGTTSFSGITTVTGAGNRLNLTSRSVTRQIPLTMAQASATLSAAPTFSTTTGAGTLHLAAGSAQSLILPLWLPHNATVTNVSLTWTSSGSPNVTAKVFKGNTELDSDSSTTPGTISFTLSELVNSASNHYRVVFTRNSGDDVTWTGCSVTCAIDEYTEW